MQLFNIGTVLLNEDGTLKRDANGDEIDAYSNFDVQNFARAWTGFAAQKARGNFEADGFTSIYLPLEINSIDPMRIVPEYRDKFPKTNLIGGMYFVSTIYIIVLHDCLTLTFICLLHLYLNFSRIYWRSFLSIMPRLAIQSFLE